MNRILLNSSELDDRGRAVVSDRRADHICRVLRLAEGGTVRIGILRGPTGTGTIERVDGQSVVLGCELDTTEAGEPPIDLLLALPRPKVMKRLWAPLASLGLGRIIITNAARVERNYFDTHWLTENAYRPLLVEGLEQSGTTWLPEVSIHRRFRPLVEDELDALCPDTVRWVGDPETPRQIREVTPEPGRRALLAVGPEGGWVPFELDLLAAHGFRRVAAPFGTLRTDVACISLLTLVAEHLRMEGAIPMAPCNLRESPTR